jgi:cellulose synthase operon protein C
VHAFVVTNIRYVGLEFGIHGYKPYRVDEVLARRYGDCKDKASLTRALLGVLGIDARLVLLRTRSLGAMPESPASLSIFNHAITWVPGLDLWLDGTASFHGTRDVPGEDRGASVLVVNPGAAPRFGRVPAGSAEDNLTTSRFRVKLDGDGGAGLEGESRIRGQAAPGYRRAYQSENDRRAVLEGALSRSFPGLTVRSVELSDLGRLEEDVLLRFHLTQPRYAERGPQGWSLAPFGAAPGYGETYAATSARKQDLALGEPWENRFTYEIAIPEGMVPADLPAPARAETPFGSYEIAVRRSGDGLVAEGRVTLRATRVAAADYPAFRDFVSGLDRAFARRVVLRPAGAGPAPAPAGGAR